MNNKLIRQGHDDRFKENFTRLSIHWDLMLLCNYKCSYCYARNENFYGTDWMTIPNQDHQNKIIEALSKSHLPLNLGLLGGEPTLYPRFIELLTKIHNRCYWNKVYNVQNNIYVVSNGSRKYEWFKKHPYFKGMSYLWSFHPEFGNLTKFIDNVKIMRDKGFGTKVNLILHPREKYWGTIEEAYQLLKNEKIKIHPHFLYQEDANTLWRYSDQFWEWSKEWFGEEYRDIEFHYLNKQKKIISKKYNDFEVYFKKINNFKGFKCANTNYEINVDGRATMFCIENRSVDLTKNIDFFKNIKDIDTIICPHKYCNCDGLLKILKYLPGYEYD